MILPAALLLTTSESKQNVHNTNDFLSFFIIINSAFVFLFFKAGVTGGWGGLSC